MQPRPSDGLETAGLVSLFIVLWIVLFVLRAWLAMILFGVVHSFWDVIPAFGFGQTAWIVVLTSILASSGNYTSKD